MEFGFFGSAVLWMLLTFPAYWLFQWRIEGESFQLWRRNPTNGPAESQPTLLQTLSSAGQISLGDGGLKAGSTN